MPIYVFKNTKTNKTYEKFISMSEREQYLNDNPEVKQVPTVPNIVGGVGGVRTDDGFKEVLQVLLLNVIKERPASKSKHNKQ